MAGLRSTLVIVGLHYVANLAHGIVHAGVPVALTSSQSAFVVLVVVLGPLLAIWLLRRERTLVGWATLAAVLTASALFGIVFHYVVPSPDHVAHVPASAWNRPFDATAAFVAVVDGGGAVFATWRARLASVRPAAGPFH